MQLRGRILTDEGFRAGTVEFGARIISLSWEQDPPGGLPLLVPGFVDAHVHGAGGGDVMDGEEGLRAAAREHARRGTTALVATTLTAPFPELEAALAGVRQLMEQPGEDEAAVLGAHLEGPWISPRRLGAQPPHARSPEVWEAERLLETARVLVVTLAPEVAGCMDLVGWLVERGVRVQIGHTEAGYEDVVRALERGAAGFTHLFNAMSPLHHRDPGTVGAALAHGEEAELILDGHHLAAGAFRAAARSLDRWYAVSDAIRATGMPDGEHRLGARSTYKRDGCCRLGDGTLAGAVCGLDVALRQLVDLGLDIAEAARRVSEVPAAVLGLTDRGRIAVGAVADLVELDENHRVRRVFVRGREVPAGAPSVDPAPAFSEPGEGDRPRVAGVLETSLYVSDLDRSEAFYRRLFGCDLLVSDARMRALAIGPAQVLLLFLTGGSAEPAETEGGTIPAHDGRGRLHVAFAIAAGAVDGWLQRLTALEIPLESRVAWPRGGTSLYFRDPDGHALELVTPGCWSNY